MTEEIKNKIQKEVTPTLKEKLSFIQNELNVPKNLYNSFGKYSYRNAETILETAKPICKKYRTTLTVFDEIAMIGERYYIKATALLKDWDSDDNEVGMAYAREEYEKKGMDGSQITGSASSYARKYALNGLFNIDDTKDADTDEQHNESEAKGKNQVDHATEYQVDKIIQNGKLISEKLAELKVKTKEDVKVLTREQASELCALIDKQYEEK